MQNIKPGIVFDICNKHPAKCCDLPFGIVELRDSLLGTMVKDPNRSLLELQSHAISNITTSMAAGNNFLLVDCMGMGKTL